jgi:nucleotide-binding universal stress UspA family protein
MPVKAILLPLSEADAPEAVLETALSLAQRFQAHLDVLYVRRNPRNLLPYATLGLSKHMREAVVQAAEQNALTLATQTRDLFKAVCGRAQVAVVESRDDGADRASAAWREATGQEDSILAVRGRLSDLIVLPGPIPVSPPPAVAEAALKATGRPVLIAPPRSEKVIASHVGIGWNGSAEAARAVGAAMAYLHSADDVTVFTCARHEDIDPPPQALVEYLGWHGVAATVKTVEAQDPSVGHALLEASRTAGVNLLVVGGYSRSRLRELVFGGVTSHLLASADIPVFMVH